MLIGLQLVSVCVMVASVLVGFVLIGFQLVSVCVMVRLCTRRFATCVYVQLVNFHQSRAGSLLCQGQPVCWAVHLSYCAVDGT